MDKADLLATTSTIQLTRYALAAAQPAQAVAVPALLTHHSSQTPETLRLSTISILRTLPTSSGSHLPTVITCMTLAATSTSQTETSTLVAYSAVARPGTVQP